MASYQIEHQPEEELFFINFSDGQRAFLKYNRLGKSSAKAAVNFFSTFVPETFRGQGLAAKLVDFGFDWAESQGLLIEASCWYAQKRLEKRHA